MNTVVVHLLFLLLFLRLLLCRGLLLGLLLGLLGRSSRLFLLLLSLRSGGLLLLLFWGGTSELRVALLRLLELVLELLSVCIHISDRSDRTANELGTHSQRSRNG